MRAFLTADPDGTVVVLGEGPGTQFWRVDNGRVLWFTVESPQTAAVREALLPTEPAATGTPPRPDPVRGFGPLQRGWMDALDTRPTDKVPATAQAY